VNKVDILILPFVFWPDSTYRKNCIDRNCHNTESFVKQVQNSVVFVTCIGINIQEVVKKCNS
jgi:hypothetical protein